MIEKLLENWLDSASERSYQPVFVQMLSAEGYTVLHSTRHCLLEFGKDILAIAPDGVGCAFQLKGDPKGRLRISSFRRDIQPQLVQLMAQTPSYPGFPEGPHRAYLVSNGQFEEEVQAAAREMNRAPYPAKIEFWSRGKLLELCKKHGLTLWPSELEGERDLLELYLSDPKDQLPLETLANMLSSILKMSKDDKALNSQELSRAASSAAWLTGIATATFAEAENHQAVAYGWALCCTLLIGAYEKHAVGDVTNAQSSLELAKYSLLDSLTALWHETEKKAHLIEGDALTDPEIYHWRIGVLFGLLSSLAIAEDSQRLLTDTERKNLHTWLKDPKHRLEIWGEAVMANIIPWVVWLRKNDASTRPDAEIYHLAKTAIERNQRNSQSPLPAPYYSFEQILRHRLKPAKFLHGDSLGHETFDGSSFTVEALLHLVARTNVKSYCKALWPSFSKLGHRRLYLEEPWQFCLFRSSYGQEETKLYQLTYTWDQLKADARKGEKPPCIPQALQSNPWLLSMWWQVAPYRVNAESVRAFCEALYPRWGT